MDGLLNNIKDLQYLLMSIQAINKERNERIKER